MNDWKNPKDWYSINLGKRKQWYSNVGEDYDRTRPPYHPKLIERVIKLTQLTPQSKLLELGSGTGKATIEFAKFNLPLLCLEPNLEFYAIAQKNCANYPHVKLELTSFEEWQPTHQLFDGIIAANAFHWLPPEISYPKSHQILKEKGYLILLWNLSLQPAWEIYQELKPSYQKFAPVLDKYETIEQQETVIRQFSQSVLDSQLFENLITEKVVCQATYSIDDYLTLLSTYSPYIALNSHRRTNLFRELKAKLETLTNETILLTYLAAAQMAQKSVHL